MVQTLGGRQRRPPRRAGPDRNTEWLLYQTLVGAWPISAERVIAYLDKATREAKIHTSWIDPKVALRGLGPSLRAGRPGRRAVRRRSGRRGGPPAPRPGWINSLAQKLITLTAPGVPDLYQGSELWDLSLVDPDNRRPVDFDLRRGLLAGLSDGGPGGHVGGRGRAGSEQAARRLASPAGPPLPPRLLRRSRAPTSRWRRPARPADHVVAFVRGGRVITSCPGCRSDWSAMGGWGDTTVRLPTGLFHNRSGRRATGVVRASGAGGPAGGPFPSPCWWAEVTLVPGVGAAGRGRRSGPRRRRAQVGHGKRPKGDGGSSRSPAPGPAPPTASASTAARPGPTPAARRSPRASTGRPQVVDHERLSPGLTKSGRGPRWPGRSCTSCTSAPSPPAGTFDGGDRATSTISSTWV